jgi:hypothetical protein
MKKFALLFQLKYPLAFQTGNKDFRLTTGPLFFFEIAFSEPCVQRLSSASGKS